MKSAATFAASQSVLVCERHLAMSHPPADTSEPAPAAERLLALMQPIHDRARMSARRLCRSEAEGDDLFQDAAIRALNKLDQLRDDQAFPAWFYRILLSLHRTRMRGHLWRRLVSLEVFTAAHDEPTGDDGQAWEEQRQGARRMREALATLSPEQREAIVLFELDGYSLEEVAERQDASLSAVKSRLTRARERLRRHYQRHGYAPSHTGEPPARPARASALENRNAI
jgi:RNA polymerase sigma-70 factor (ECF subfamily)